MLTKNKITNKLEQILDKTRVLSSKEECYAYAQDGTNNRVSRMLPDAVVFPESIEEVQEVLRYANNNKIPITARGAGTNLIGGALPEKGGIVLNLSRMNRIISVSKTDMTATVEAGVVVGELQSEVENIGLFFPPDPSNLRVSTIGGAIVQSAGGPKTFKYGTVKDYILGLTIVLADGTIMKTGASTIKNATGYNLTQLFVGSEGTLGIVVEAILKLIPKPETTSVVMAYYDSLDTAVESVTHIVESNIYPATIDFMENNSIRTVEKFYPANLLTDKEAVLIIELDGSITAVEADKQKLCSILEKYGASNIIVSNSKEEADRIWTARRSSFAAAAKLKPDVISDDVIVPRSKLAQLVKETKNICAKYNLHTCIVGHVGDGNIHPQIVLNLDDEVECLNYIRAKEEIYKLTLSLGGTLSAEHGIGLEKKKYIPQAIDPVALNYMHKMKQLFDPNNILNPDKAI